MYRFSAPRAVRLRRARAARAPQAHRAGRAHQSGGDKGVIGDLVLHDYEEAADAIYNFSQYHDEVTAFGRRQLLQNLCGKDAKKWRYRCSRQQASSSRALPCSR